MATSGDYLTATTYYPLATCVYNLTGNSKLGRREMVIVFELAAEMGGLLVPQIHSHFFHGLTGCEAQFRSFQALRVQPNLRRQAKLAVKIPLQLPDGLIA